MLTGGNREGHVWLSSPLSDEEPESRQNWVTQQTLLSVCVESSRSASRSIKSNNPGLDFLRSNDH